MNEVKFKSIFTFGHGHAENAFRLILKKIRLTLQSCAKFSHENQPFKNKISELLNNSVGILNTYLLQLKF